MKTQVDTCCKNSEFRIAKRIAAAFVVDVSICFVLIENSFHFYFSGRRCLYLPLLILLLLLPPFEFNSFHFVCWCFTRMKTNRLCCLIDVVACNVHLKFWWHIKIELRWWTAIQRFNRHQAQCVHPIWFGFICFSFHFAFVVVVIAAAATKERCERKKKDFAKALNVSLKTWMCMNASHYTMRSWQWRRRWRWRRWWRW